MATLTLNFTDHTVDLPRPAIMGIVNATPDSFYSGSRAEGTNAGWYARRLQQNGADIIDLGAYSSRPGAAYISANREYDRLAPALEAIKKECGSEMPVSIDTFRANVAEKCIKEFGPLIINDISGGTLDADMTRVVAEWHVPYVLMHMRGTPQTMSSQTDYTDVVAEVIEDLMRKADAMTQAGVADIILDPGFGFAKTTEQNYELMKALPQFKQTGLPLLVGISRKSMIYKPLGITPRESLTGTTVLNTVALLSGADILRVHDVTAAAQARTLCSLLQNDAANQ